MVHTSPPEREKISGKSRRARDVRNLTFGNSPCIEYIVLTAAESLTLTVLGPKRTNGPYFSWSRLNVSVQSPKFW